MRDIYLKKFDRVLFAPDAHPTNFSGLKTFAQTRGQFGIDCFTDEDGALVALGQALYAAGQIDCIANDSVLSLAVIADVARNDMAMGCLFPPLRRSRLSRFTAACI